MSTSTVPPRANRTANRGRRRVANYRIQPRRVARSESAELAPASGASGIQVKSIREGLGLSRKVFARLTSFSERAIAGWESGASPSAAVRQRMSELQRLQQALATVMKPDHIPIWLDQPNPAFHALKPLEVIERGEIDRIWRMIFELQSGVAG